MKKLIFLSLLFPSLVSAQSYPQTHCVSAAPTADTAIYASGDLIGGKLTLSNAVRDTRGTGYIVSVAVVDQAAQAHDLEVVVFNQDPTGTTFTDQAALDIADADVSKVAAVVSLGSATRFAWSDNGYKYLGSLTLPVEAQDASGIPSSTLYAAILSRGTPTFAASTDLRLIVCISGD